MCLIDLQKLDAIDIGFKVPYQFNKPRDIDINFKVSN